MIIHRDHYPTINRLPCLAKVIHHLTGYTPVIHQLSIIYPPVLHHWFTIKPWGFLGSWLITTTNPQPGHPGPAQRGPPLTAPHRSRCPRCRGGRAPDTVEGRCCSPELMGSKNREWGVTIVIIITIIWIVIMGMNSYNNGELWGVTY